MAPRAFAVALLIAGCGCAAAPPRPAPPPPKKPVELQPLLGERSPRPAELAVLPPAPEQARATAIVGATLLLGDGRHLDDGVVVFEHGRITAVGPSATTPAPSGAQVIDGHGKFVTPGLIDTHSHLGVYAVPNVEATADGNEMTDPTTPYVFSEHSFWPQDPAIESAVAGGVTTIQVLPGSGNIIGGRSVVLKLRPRLETRAMRFPGAPNGLKMACGENPKRVYGSTGRAPMTRMGSMSKLRAIFIKAQEYRYNQRAYQVERDAWQKKYDRARASPADAEDPGKEPRAPDRDLGLETLADVLDGKVRVQMHCYRADEMLTMIGLARELGFKIASFHHAVEAYKIADVLAREGIAASVWSDWWGMKLELYDAIEENAAMVAAAGGRAVIHSDSELGIQRLNQDAAKALASGRRAGIQLSDDQAIPWITQNPASVLGIEGEVGTLATGKMADLVLWDKPPLSIYASAQQVFIDGALVFDRSAPRAAWSDFETASPSDGVGP